MRSPTFLTLLSTPTTLSGGPRQTLGTLTNTRPLGGLWSVHTIAVCMSRDHGAVSSFRECGLSCGLRGTLWTLHLCRSAVPLLHRCHTRYRWLVRPSWQGLALQETPSFAWRTNASAQPPLEAVGCSALILIEAPSPADHRGMLIRGKTC